MSALALLAALGWTLALGGAVLALELHRRLELGTRAEHELRGPVTAVGLAVESLGRTSGDRRRVEAVESELGRLRLALEDLRAARAGRRAPPHFAPVAVERLVRAAADAWEPAARREGGGLTVDWTAGEATLLADGRRVAQALSNVLANAVEHGGGRVRVEGRSIPGGVRVEVRDSGPGRLLEGAARPDRASGRGRGLLVAERAVRESGGRIDVKSRERGTAVAIDLPAGCR